MWYAIWIFGILLAVSFSILTVLWFENNQQD